MPIDKNKLIRFQALDRCFSDQVHKYYIEDLIEACRKALSYASVENPSVSRSTIFNDIKEMSLNRSWPNFELLDRKESTSNGRHYYRYKDPNYSIWKQDLDEFQLSQLQSILLMLRQFKDFPQYDAIEDIIEQLEKNYNFKLANTEGTIAFETNDNLDALSKVGKLFSYISHKQVLKVVYHPFLREPSTYAMHPHFLKQYNRRWFLIGLTISENGMRGRSVFPLDRLESIEQISSEYIPSDKDLEDLFDDQIGVTLTKGDPVLIKLKLSPKRYQYVTTKPIHASQRIVNEEEHIISINVKLNKELYQTLLSFGSDLQVLEPMEVRKEMKEEIEQMKKSFFCPETLDK